jgi:uncharacterized protein with NRDE domain
MCTLIVASRIYEQCPLLVAANRDERLGRPAQPPTSLQQDTVFAPLDVTASGTWLGVREGGIFVGITNRAGQAPDPSRRSRGLLVLDALSEGSVASAVERVLGHPVKAHNPFHLVIADRNRVWVIVNNGVATTSHELPPGIRLITESSFGARPNGRDARVSRLLEQEDWASREPSTEAIQALLAEHAGLEDPLASLCVHAEAFDYGTRSSTIIRLGVQRDRVDFHHAEGPPCVTPFVDLSDQVRNLSGGSSRSS